MISLHDYCGGPLSPNIDFLTVSWTNFAVFSTVSTSGPPEEFLSFDIIFLSFIFSLRFYFGTSWSVKNSTKCSVRCCYSRSDLVSAADAVWPPVVIVFGPFYWPRAPLVVPGIVLGYLLDFLPRCLADVPPPVTDSGLPRLGFCTLIFNALRLPVITLVALFRSSPSEIWAKVAFDSYYVPRDLIPPPFWLVKCD